MTSGWGSIYGKDARDKGMDDARPGQDRVGLRRFHLTTQNGERFKTHELFTSGIVHVIFQTMVDNG